MCAQYTLKLDRKEILEKFKLSVPENFDQLSSRILPHSIAPVIVKDKDKLRLVSMRYSLIPNWSVEAKVKFATYNARIETVTEKPTWKIPFQSQHCLVPLTAFFESVYTGPEAGNIIRLSHPNDETLYVAGIFDFWKNSTDITQHFFSFSVLTQTPSQFILEHGHDRTPIFVKENFALDWLRINSKNAEAMKTELLENAYHPPLKIEIDRALKSGWEKRI